MLDSGYFSWKAVQQAIKSKFPIPRVYPSKRRFEQLINEIHMKIKTPKKEYCDMCIMNEIMFIIKLTQHLYVDARKRIRKDTKMIGGAF